MLYVRRYFGVYKSDKNTALNLRYLQSCIKDRTLGSYLTIEGRMRYMLMTARDKVFVGRMGKKKELS